MRRSLFSLFGVLLLACVGKDEALSLGSVSFVLDATLATEQGLGVNAFIDDWTVKADRIAVSMKTVTIGQSNNPDACSYRGRGAVSNVVFDPRRPVSQVFNGLAPGVCPDVGLILAPPDNQTTPTEGITGDDIVDLASGNPAHALADFTATREDDTYRVKLRFDTLRASSHYAGCRSTRGKGASVRPDERETHRMTFTAEAFFRQAIAAFSTLRFQPFIDADELGDGDHVVTMSELDALPLAAVRTYSDFYELPDGTRNGSFGDFVRAQIKFAFLFDDDGQCFGNDPGTDDTEP